MLPVKLVIASANFSSLLASRFCVLRRSRRVSMFLRSAELNSPPRGYSSMVCLEDTRNSAGSRWHGHPRRTHLGSVSLRGRGIVSRDRVALQIVIIEVCKSCQGIPVLDLQPSRVPFHQFKMP